METSGLKLRDRLIKMAIILKEGKTYSAALMSNYGGEFVSSDFYAAIDVIEYNKIEKTCSWFVDIYTSSSARTSGKQPIDRAVFNLSGVDFENEVGSNGFSITDAYIYSLSKPLFTHWQSDE